MSSTQERAILAGGCFWGMQDLIRRYPGVISTRVGYSGGEVRNATYRNHGSHAEAIEIIFDPQKLSFRQLLEYFFQIHDPTTLNRQGNDRGTSYRSAIFYTSEEQKLAAEETIADVNASGLWPGKVVTEVRPAGDFWEAEPEHQDYPERYPHGYPFPFAQPNWELPARKVEQAPTYIPTLFWGKKMRGVAASRHGKFFLLMVGLGGLEPPTSHLSELRSLVPREEFKLAAFFCGAAICYRRFTNQVPVPQRSF